MTNQQQINLVVNIQLGQSSQDVKAQVEQLTSLLVGVSSHMPAQPLNITLNSQNQDFANASRTPHFDQFLAMQKNASCNEQEPQIYNRESISELSSQSSDSSEIPAPFLRNISIPYAASDNQSISSAHFANSDRNSKRGGKQITDSIFDQDFLNVRGPRRGSGDLKPFPTSTSCLGKRTNEQRGDAHQAQDFSAPKLGLKLTSLEQVYQSEMEPLPAAVVLAQQPEDSSSEPKSTTAIVHMPKYDRKDNTQLSILLKAFAASPVWSYGDKVRIAEQVGMTYHKVSKWNWDHRKKMGVDTNRRAQKAADKQ